MDYISGLVPQRTRKGAEGVCLAKSFRPRPAQEAHLLSHPIKKRPYLFGDTAAGICCYYLFLANDVCLVEDVLRNGEP